MPGIEYFRNVSIGQYVDVRSPVHAYTPVTKLLVFAALAAASLATPGFPGLALLAAATLACALAARIPPRFLLRGVVPALPFLGVAAVLQLLFAWPGDRSRVLVRFLAVTVTEREVTLALLLALRCSALILVVGLFTSVTPESAVAHGLEDLFAPLSRIGVPSFRIALAVSTAFRFVPIVAGEIEAIVRAQASRGADFGARKGGPVAKARAYLPLFVPVTIRSLERATALAEAMEARCYTETGRSRYLRYSRLPGESVLRIVAVLAAAAIVAADVLISHIRTGP